MFCQFVAIVVHHWVYVDVFFQEERVATSIDQQQRSGRLDLCYQFVLCILFYKYPFYYSFVFIFKKIGLGVCSWHLGIDELCLYVRGM